MVKIRKSMTKTTAVFILSLASLAACTVYQPKPLSMPQALPKDTAHLLIDTAKVRLPTLASHRFDPSDGLDITEVAMLAVANNPQLKINRDDVGIARAQAFAAGLLPDPQLALNRDTPTSGGSDLTSAFGMGLTFDVNALLSHSAVKGSADATLRQADMNLLWQEWQVVAQARLLFVRNLQQQKLLAILQQQNALLTSRNERIQHAFDRGDVTVDVKNADLAAWYTLQTSINELTRQITKNRFELNALLGLAPEAQLELTGDSPLLVLDTQKIQNNFASMIERRPDLLALKAGYESQEQKFRQAVLAQFPVLSVGLTRARDTSNIYTSGIGITLSLPIFNRNHGNIAIEQASRLKLFDEYQLRINTANSEIQVILQDQQLLNQQLASARSGVLTLEKAASQAQDALNKGIIDLLSYTNIRSAWLSKQVEVNAIEQLLLEQQVAIQTLIGSVQSDANK